MAALAKETQKFLAPLALVAWELLRLVVLRRGKALRQDQVSQPTGRVSQDRESPQGGRAALQGSGRASVPVVGIFRL